MRVLVLMIVWLLVVGCIPDPVQGPPVDLEEAARPAPVIKTPPPALVVRPTPPKDLIEVWVPRRVTAQGDATEGHWEVVSTTAPLPEVRAPEVTMPRAPSSPPPARAIPPQQKRPTPAQSGPPQTPQVAPSAATPPTWGTSLDAYVQQRGGAPAGMPGIPLQGGMLP